MFDFNSLIGLELSKAKQLLCDYNYNYNIDTIINSKHDEKCDCVVVCQVKVQGNNIVLVCGEFLVGI